MASYSVKLGFWMNWRKADRLTTEEGRMDSLTLTLHPQHGFIHISATSLLVGFAVAQLQDIITFLLLEQWKIRRQTLENWMGMARNHLEAITKNIPVGRCCNLACCIGHCGSIMLFETGDMVLLQTMSCGWVYQQFANTQYQLRTYSIEDAEATFMSEIVGLRQSLDYSKACYA
jgi:hypothetical protein